MTEATSKEMTPELKRWIEIWKSSLEEVLSQIAGQPMKTEIPGDPLAAAPDDLWYTVTCGGAVSGEMSMRIPAASGSVLAQMLLGEGQPAAAELTAEHKEALEELLRQLAGRAATALTSAGGAVQLSVAASAPPSWTAAAAACFRQTGETAPAFRLEIQISIALLNALAQAPVAAIPEAATAPSPPSTVEAGAHPPATGTMPANYERLMDVELEVKLRFGSRHMELRDVLALSLGSVVELDRNIGAPVDLLLDGRVIAQGDMVVVDGKYGLRITEVLDVGPAACGA